MKLLIVASLPMEFAGIRAPRHRVSMRADWARSTRLGDHEALLVANGAGAHRASAAVDAAFQTFQPDALISTGFCGALDPKLQLAEIIVGSESTRAVNNATPHHVGPVITIDHIAQTAEEKRRLRATGAIAVDMEASIVAARATALDLPFFCVKSVTDLADESMANNLNSALRPDGHFDTIKVLKEVLRHPTVRLPELVRFRKRGSRAAQSLGDFLGSCRF